MIFWNLPRRNAENAKGMGCSLLLRSLRSFAVSTLIAAVSQADYVTIGSPGVAADPATGYGTVNYTYQISRYEVTGAEFNAAAAADSRIGDCSYDSLNGPAYYVSWYEAALYCNYLTSGNAYSGAYQFDSGGTYLGTDRAAAVSTYGTVYALPTEDEWYKAAYWTGDESDPWSLYANGTDGTPTRGAEGWNFYDGEYNPIGSWGVGSGSEEQNGTYDMMGNVWEWLEGAYNESKHLMRGGSDATTATGLRSTAPRGGGYSDFEYSDVGFRIVMIPEPSTILLVFIGGVSVLALRRSKKRGEME